MTHKAQLSYSCFEFSSSNQYCAKKDETFIFRWFMTNGKPSPLSSDFFSQNSGLLFKRVLPALSRRLSLPLQLSGSWLGKLAAFRTTTIRVRITMVNFLNGHQIELKNT